MTELEIREIGGSHTNDILVKLKMNERRIGEGERELDMKEESIEKGVRKGRYGDYRKEIRWEYIWEKKNRSKQYR